MYSFCVYIYIYTHTYAYSLPAWRSASVCPSCLPACLHCIYRSVYLSVYLCVYTYIHIYIYVHMSRGIEKLLSAASTFSNTDSLGLKRGKVRGPNFGTLLGYFSKLGSFAGSCSRVPYYLGGSQRITLYTFCTPASREHFAASHSNLCNIGACFGAHYTIIIARSPPK